MQNTYAAEIVLPLDLKVRCNPVIYRNNEVKNISIYDKIYIFYNAIMKKLTCFLIKKSIEKEKCHHKLDRGSFSPKVVTSCNRFYTPVATDGEISGEENYIFCPFCGKEIEVIND